jgi:hypothetical protein
MAGALVEQVAATFLAVAALRGHGVCATACSLPWLAHYGNNTIHTTVQTVFGGFDLYGTAIACSCMLELVRFVFIGLSSMSMPSRSG